MPSLEMDQPQQWVMCLLYALTVSVVSWGLATVAGVALAFDGMHKVKAWMQEMIQQLVTMQIITTTTLPWMTSRRHFWEAEFMRSVDEIATSHVVEQSSACRFSSAARRGGGRRFPGRRRQVRQCMSGQCEPCPALPTVQSEAQQMQFFPECTGMGQNVMGVLAFWWLFKWSFFSKRQGTLGNQCQEIKYEKPCTLPCIQQQSGARISVTSVHDVKGDGNCYWRALRVSDGVQSRQPLPHGTGP